MGKDLSKFFRGVLEDDARDLVDDLVIANESLALAREAWLSAFDNAVRNLEE